VGLSRKERRADKNLVRAVALEIDCAPVDPMRIAESLGIVVQASDKLEGSFSGCLIQAGNSFGIFYFTDPKAVSRRACGTSAKRICSAWNF
jgi:hypothetical protein